MSDDIYVFICPHCNEEIIVLKKELNCKIFRHAVFKSNYEPIHPHASKQECQRLIDNHLIYGCGKPFQVVLKDHQLVAVECDYI